ncbi:hypothetical protein BDR26DRAFT_863954 [Obelidium mucronatum]|nr:hypothetical protein BDR26DRAFT_863954 [Obelidium mucronatum]
MDAEFDAIQSIMNSRVHANQSKSNLHNTNASLLTELNLPQCEISHISPVKVIPRNQASRYPIIPPVFLEDPENDSIVDENGFTVAQMDDDAGSSDSYDHAMSYEKTIRKAFTAWLLLTRRSRHERSFIVTNWVLAVQVWKSNSLAFYFESWKSALDQRNVGPKAFKHLHDHAFIPTAQAKHNNQQRLLNGCFKKWLHKAYKSRSFKRKQELNQDLAVAVYEIHVVRRYLKTWRRIFIKNFLLADSLERISGLIEFHLKRQSFKVWNLRLRNARVSVNFRKSSLISNFFGKWKKRKQQNKIEKRATTHQVIRKTDLVSQCFQKWQDKLKLRKSRRFELKQKYFDIWILWTNDKRILTIVADSLESDNNLAHMHNFFYKWKQIFIREYSLKTRLKAWKLHKLKKSMLQWIRHTRYMRLVDPFHAKISQKSYQISRMLFYETGSQVRSLDELNGLCDIVKDVIKTSVVDRLSSCFTTWQNKCDFWVWKGKIAEKHNALNVYQKLFPIWKTKLREYVDSRTCAVTNSNKKMLEVFWIQWRKRKKEKTTLTWYVRHEEFLSNQMARQKRNALFKWQEIFTRKKKLNRIECAVAVLSENYKLRRYLLLWIERLNKNVAEYGYIVVESNMHVKNLIFQTWRRSCQKHWESAYEAQLVFQEKYFRKWMRACQKKELLRRSLNAFVSAKQKTRLRDSFCWWKRKRQIKLYRLAGEIVRNQKNHRTIKSTFRFWLNAFRISKAHRFRVARLTLNHWTIWKTNISEKTQSVLATLLYQKWIKILAFQRWIVVFQKRINASVFATAQQGIEMAPADLYSLRRIPYDKYPSYYTITTKKDSDERDPKPSLTNHLLSIRVSGWATASATAATSSQYPTTASAALTLNRSSPPSLRRSFGTLFEISKQEQETTLRQGFKTWKQHTKKISEIEAEASLYRIYSLKRAFFGIWKSRAEVCRTWDIVEGIVSRKRELKVEHSYFKIWETKASQNRFRFRIVDAELNRRLLTRVLGVWRHALLVRRAVSRIDGVKAFLTLKGVFLRWKRRCQESRRERYLCDKATAFWSRKSCRRVFDGIRSVLLDRQVQVAISAISFLELRKRIHFRRWKDAALLRLKKRVTARMADEFRKRVAVRNAVHRWRSATFKSFKFGVIEVRLGQLEKRRLEIKVFEAWKRRAGQARMADEFYQARRMKRLGARFFSVWRDKWSQIGLADQFCEGHIKGPLKARVFEKWKGKARVKADSRIADEQYRSVVLRRLLGLWKRKLGKRIRMAGIEAGIVKIGDILDRGRLKRAFEGFKDLHKKCKSLQTIYISSLRLKTCRAIGVPRTLKTSIQQLQGLLLLKSTFDVWMERYLLNQMCKQHRKISLMTAFVRKWRGAYNLQRIHSATSKEFYENSVKTRVWDIWNRRLSLSLVRREEARKKREILMAWYRWASREKKIRCFILTRKFLKWRDRLYVKERLQSMKRKADRLRRFNLAQFAFYRWWRIANLSLGSGGGFVEAASNGSSTPLPAVDTQTQLSTDWLAQITSAKSHNSSGNNINNKNSKNSTKVQAIPTGFSSESLVLLTETAGILTAEQYLQLQETADDFHASKQYKKGWKRWIQASRKKNFERERKMVFASTWAQKVLKKKVLMGWMSVALSK